MRHGTRMGKVFSPYLMHIAFSPIDKVYTFKVPSFAYYQHSDYSPSLVTPGTHNRFDFPAGSLGTTYAVSLCVPLDQFYASIGFLTMSVNSECATSAAANTVVSPGLSYMGATSTTMSNAVFQHLQIAARVVRTGASLPTSAPTTSIPSRPSRIESNSRVVQPPTSAVPVAARYSC